MRFDEPTLSARELATALGTTRIGRQIETLSDADSTNDVCWARLTQTGQAADGYMVIADFQSAGRGRFNRTWLAPRASSLLVSILLLQPDEPLLTERLSLIVGIAACTAARKISEADIQLRWPNDLVCAKRKVGGILVESRPGKGGHVPVVLGIGINCLQHKAHFPPELRTKAASLDMVSSLPISRFDLAVNLARQLDAWLSPRILTPPDQVRAKWLELAEPLGRRVRLTHAGKHLYGTTVELDPTGALLVQLESGGRQLFQAATTTMEIAE